MSQGLAQTEGPQLFVRGSLRLGNAQAGAQWKNVDSASANGVAALFIKAKPRLGRMQLEAGAAYRIRTGAAANARAWEFSAGSSTSFGRWGMRAYGEYSPDEFGRGPSLYLELGPRAELGKALQISGAVGLRARSGDPDYRIINAGVTRTIGHGASIDLRFHASDRGYLGAAYRGRIIVSLRVSE